MERGTNMSKAKLLNCTMSKPSTVYANKMIHNNTWGWSWNNLLMKIRLLTGDGWHITKPIKNCGLNSKTYKRIKNLKFSLGPTKY